MFWLKRNMLSGSYLSLCGMKSPRWLPGNTFMQPLSSVAGEIDEGLTVAMPLQPGEAVGPQQLSVVQQSGYDAIEPTIHAAGKWIRLVAGQPRTASRACTTDATSELSIAGKNGNDST